MSNQNRCCVMPSSQARGVPSLTREGWYNERQLAAQPTFRIPGGTKHILNAYLTHSCIDEQGVFQTPLGMIGLSKTPGSAANHPELTIELWINQL